MIYLSEHAVQRFVQRVRPGLTFRQADRELARLIGVGIVQAQRPAWCTSQEPRGAYLMIGDDVCLPLERQRDGWVAVTCLTAGMMGESERRRRNMVRSQRTTKRRWMKQARDLAA